MKLTQKGHKPDSPKSKKATKEKVIEIDFQTAIANEIETKIKNLTTQNPTPHPAELVTWYWLEKPFAAAAITKEKTDYVYHVITPSLTPP